MIAIDLGDTFDAMAKRAQSAGKQIDPIARMAVNDAADFSRSFGASDITKQFNVTSSYLKGGDSPRLGVVKRASNTSLEAIVRGRDRATSLARFSKTALPAQFGKQKRSPTVAVLKGSGGKQIPKSFYVRLRNGNVGIAVRLKKGDTVQGKNKMVSARRGYYLLYGPSVDQMFRSTSLRTVEPATVRFLATFNRLAAGL